MYTLRRHTLNAQGQHHLAASVDASLDSPTTRVEHGTSARTRPERRTSLTQNVRVVLWMCAAEETG